MKQALLFCALAIMLALGLAGCRLFFAPPARLRPATPGSSPPAKPPARARPPAVADAWSRLSLLFVAGGIAAGICWWKLRPLFVPVLGGIAALAAGIAVRALIVNIAWLLAGVAAVTALNFILLWLRKTAQHRQAEAVTDTLIDAVEAAGPEAKSAAARQAHRAGTQAALDDRLRRKELLGRSNGKGDAHGKRTDM